MQDTDIPAKFPIPWASAAGGAYRRAIPTASQIGIQNGAASLTDGFPPLNFLPVASGGVPPFGADVNGILQQITQWNRWQQAGGPIYRDSTYSTAIGGYPRGSLLTSTQGDRLWLSTTQNNTTDPNAGGAGWVPLASAWSARAFFASGSTNVYTGTLSPAATNYTQLEGVPLRVVFPASNTGFSTLNLNGLGNRAILNADATTLLAGQIIPGGYTEVIYDGTAFRLLAPKPGFVNLQMFTANSAWVAPPGVYRTKARGWGGGGGGGGGNPTGAGGGASGAGYSEGVFDVVPGASYTVTIGVGGAGGGGSANGGDGGATLFGGFLFAGGGFGGPGVGAGLAGGQATVGTSSGGQLNISGSVGLGANGPVSGIYFSGFGGSAHCSPGGMPAIGGVGVQGNAGAFPGGGGSGGVVSFGGGGGGNGLLLLEW